MTICLQAPPYSRYLFYPCSSYILRLLARSDFIESQLGRDCQILAVWFGKLESWHCWKWEISNKEACFARGISPCYCCAECDFSSLSSFHFNCVIYFLRVYSQTGLRPIQIMCLPCSDTSEIWQNTCWNWVFYVLVGFLGWPWPAEDSSVCDSRWNQASGILSASKFVLKV